MTISEVTKRGGLDAPRELKISAPTLAMCKWHDACIVQSYRNPGAGTMAEGVDASQWSSRTNKEHEV
jgi:hypothetical protein